MSYKKGRFTFSKKDSTCNHCKKQINKGNEIYIVPGQTIIHKHCYDAWSKT